MRSESLKKTPPMLEMIQLFAKIGFLSFGGPAAQIALMHRMLVVEKGWLDEKQYLGALSFCMLLPGPEAMQIATYAGWRMQGILGGLIAGLLFVLPGAILILAVACIYAVWGNIEILQTLFLGIKACVLSIVLVALLRVARKALKMRAHWFIALCSFISLFLLSLPYPLIILTAAIYGYFFMKAQTNEIAQTYALDVSFLQTFKILGFGFAFWFLPIVCIDLLSGYDTLIHIALFFSKLAVVTFGGAYAVLAYMTQDVVTYYGWLEIGEMMDGLGLAETTPGPLILVTEFVGFLAAFREGGIWVGIAGAMLTLWVTFVPCFIWIFVGAPYIEWIIAQPRLNGALSAITAAVVGVILNLSLWFGGHVFFTTFTQETYGILTIQFPDFDSLDWRIAVLSSVAAVLLLRFHWGIAKVLGISMGLGWCLTFYVA